MRPFIVLAFANDLETPARRLRNLAGERREILAALRPAADAGRCRIIDLPAATAGELFDEFQRAGQRGEIAVLHFGGHADSYDLLLESADGVPSHVDGAGLARFLGHARGLQLVFLNGCATRGHVRGLLDAGVPAVISTSRAVDDAVARAFAARFYRGLGEGLGIREAFGQAEHAVGATRPRGVDGGGRHLGAAGRRRDGFPWELSIREGAERVETWTPGTPPLPPVPRRDLPERPFRHLQRFTAEHAELFFGREWETWELYGRVTSHDGPPVILLYGQAGVGKSSLLDAGLLPRLEAAHDVRYARRDPALGLSGTLVRAVCAGAPAPEGELAPAWRRAEAERGRPLLVIVDQVEEAFTRAADPGAELAALARTLGELFRDVERRPAGKVILGFRKEWLAEVEAALREAEVPRRAQFLPRLSRDGVVAAITGPARDPRPRAHYGLAVEEGLAERIAADLLRDEDSHVAPLLQILLSAMWDAAVRRDRAHPRFDRALYESLTLYRAGQEGRPMLDDFLGQQLGALAESHPAAAGSGLALDFLAFHTTHFGTARERTGTEGAREYAHQAGAISALRGALTDLYLLTDVAERAAPGEAATRLAHDTLAPLVRRRFEESDAPGQRARRILESRGADWSGGRTGAPLDSTDLALVERGVEGMRARGADEERLVEASRTRRARELRAHRRNRSAAAAAIVLVVVSLVVVLAQWRRSERQAANAASQVLAGQAINLRASHPDLALLASVAAYERSPTLEARAALASTLAGLSPYIRTILRDRRHHVSSVAFSGDGRVATAGLGRIILWNLATGEVTDSVVVAGDVSEMVFSPDGKWLAASGGNLVGVWDAASLRPRWTFRSPFTVRSACSFSADSRLLAVAEAGEPVVLTWNVLTGEQQRVNLPFIATALAFSPDAARPALALGQHTGSVLVVDPRTWAAVASLPPPSNSGPVEALLFSPLGTRLAIRSRERVWNVTRLGSAAQPSVEWKSFDGRVAAFLGEDRMAVKVGSGELGFVDLRSDVLVDLYRQKLPNGNAAMSLAVSRDGRWLASADVLGMTLLWDVSTPFHWREIGSPGLGANAPDVRSIRWAYRRAPTALSPDGTVLAVADSAGLILWEPERGRSEWRAIPPHEDRAGITFSGDGKYVAVQDDSVLLWDVARGGPFVVVGRGGSHQGAPALDHDGGQIAYRGASLSTVYYRRISSREDPVRIDRQHRFSSLAFDPQGGLLAIADSGGPISLWNTRSRRVERVLGGHTSSVYRLKFSPDGRLLASGDEQGNFLLWDLGSQRATSTPLVNDQREVLRLAFSSDGALLASSYLGGDIALWDVHERRLLGVWENVHHFTLDHIAGLAFVNGDTQLVSATGGGRVQRIDITPRAWIARACRTANGTSREDEWRRRFPAEAFPSACRGGAAPGAARARRAVPE